MKAEDPTLTITPHPALTPPEYLILESERPTEWLVAPLFAAGETSLVVGSSHSGKTFVLMDLGLAVAYGRPWLGKYDVPEARPVVYAPTEGRSGFSKRFRAATDRTPYAELPPFFTYQESLNLSRPSTVVTFREAVKAAEPGLVIVDVFRDTTPGIPENSDEFGDAFGLLRDVAHETGAAVIVAHHLGKDSTKGARGHSSLKDKTDQEVQLRCATTMKGGKIVRTAVGLENTKNRNQENWGTLGVEIAKPPGSCAPVVSLAKSRIELQPPLVALVEAVAEVCNQSNRSATGEGTTYAELVKATALTRQALNKTAETLATLGYAAIDKTTKPHRVKLTPRGFEVATATNATQLQPDNHPAAGVQATAPPPIGGAGCTGPTTVEKILAANRVTIDDILNGPIEWGDPA